MELQNALKQAESRLSIAGDKITMMQGKLEDLVFRAQRIGAALRAKTPVQDTMFGYDMQHFRREVRAFQQEILALPGVLGSLERDAVYIPGADKLAQSLMRLAGRVHKQVQNLHNHALLAHTHIRLPEHKMDAWYICQDIEEMTQKSQALPTLANKVVIKTAPPSDPAAPAGGAPAST